MVPRLQKDRKINSLLGKSTDVMDHRRTVRDLWKKSFSYRWEFHPVKEVLKKVFMSYKIWKSLVGIEYLRKVFQKKTYSKRLSSYRGLEKNVLAKKSWKRSVRHRRPGEDFQPPVKGRQKDKRPKKILNEIKPWNVFQRQKT